MVLFNRVATKQQMIVENMNFKQSLSYASSPTT